MTGLDANVLLRYFLQDDPAQSPRAVQIVERELNSDRPGYISLIAVAEVVWVLSNSYSYTREQVVRVIHHILGSRTLQVQNNREIFVAISAFAAREGDFADCLIGALGQWSGCSHTLTFDRRASRLPGMKLI